MSARTSLTRCLGVFTILGGFTLLGGSGCKEDGTDTALGASGTQDEDADAATSEAAAGDDDPNEDGTENGEDPPGMTGGGPNTPPIDVDDDPTPTDDTPPDDDDAPPADDAPADDTPPVDDDAPPADDTPPDTPPDDDMPDDDMPDDDTPPVDDDPTDGGPDDDDTPDGGTPAICGDHPSCEEMPDCAPCVTVVGCGNYCVEVDTACETFCPDPDVCTLGPGETGPEIRCELPPCPLDGTRCNGICVDTSSQNQNCGACGVVCEAPEACVEGQCLGPGECTNTETSCDGECVDTTTDASHCGNCETACGPGERCGESQCYGRPEAGSCGADPGADVICTDPKLPNAFQCVFYDEEFVEYTPPPDCVLATLGDTQDLYCCP